MASYHHGAAILNRARSHMIQNGAPPERVTLGTVAIGYLDPNLELLMLVLC